MSALALEINDLGLLALRGGASRPEPESPGLALLDGERLVVGAEAAGQAWTKPRFLHDAFWDHLDTQPVGRPFPPDVTRADLAHAHILALREGAAGGASEVVLVVPGSWSAPALGLLLSVARAAGLPVVGLVDAAVAAASLGHPGQSLLHLDLTRHRSVLTEMAQGDEVVRLRVLSSERLGWQPFEEAFAAGIAARFVRETRFDPLHVGATEQALHDALPGWLEELGLREALTVGLAAGGREHRIELTRAALLAATADLYRGLVEQVGLVKRVGEPATLLLSARAARLPGLADRFREIRDLALAELPLGAAVAGALQHLERLRSRGEALPFVTRLPSGIGDADRAALAAAAPAGPPAAGPGGARRPSGSPPTHILNGSTAHAIGPEGLAVGTAPPPGVRGLALRGETTGVSRHHCTLHAGDVDVVVEDHSSWGTLVNGERVDGRAVVHAGDRLRLGERELLLIAVAGEE